MATNVPADSLATAAAQVDNSNNSLPSASGTNSLQTVNSAALYESPTNSDRDGAQQPRPQGTDQAQQPTSTTMNSQPSIPSSSTNLSGQWVDIPVPTPMYLTPNARTTAAQRRAENVPVQGEASFTAERNARDAPPSPSVNPFADLQAELERLQGQLLDLESDKDALKQQNV